MRLWSRGIRKLNSTPPLVVTPGLSLALAIDLCIRHGLASQLESLLFPALGEGPADHAAPASDEALVELLEEVGQ